ncbi:ricin-type beta-trefoil lectin domain protein [Paracoccaceae bacterium]|nr:ricin-type beta-trefoil lectin domain protein [Paracoccaceae bacterium]
MRKLTLLVYLLFLFPNIALGEIVEIFSLNQLDDNRGFCIDIRGHKSKAKVNKGLQAHTCYSYQGEVAIDQGFDSLKLTKNQFYLPAFDVCMEANTNTASSSLILRKCQDEKLQKFEWDNEDNIHLIDNEKLCLTVSQGKSRKGGGGSPVHLIRNLSLELCSDTLQPFQKWSVRKTE